MEGNMEKMGASFLADNGYEIQRTNNFEIQIDGIFGENDKRTLLLSVVSGFLPNESNEVISLNYGNSTVTVAGKATVNNSGSLVVRDFIGENTDVEALIDEWRKSVYDKDKEIIGFASDYKKEAIVTQCAPDGTIQRSWTLKGVWPSAVDYGSVSYDSPGVKTISITLQYDRAQINPSRYKIQSNTTL